MRKRAAFLFACVVATPQCGLANSGAAQPSVPPANQGTPGAPGAKFEVREGTGESKTVRQQIPAVSTPIEPRPLDAVDASIARARSDGGQAMDPQLRDINLPGLKPDDPQLRPWVLHTRNGINEIVSLSENFINRIATPFVKPSVIDPSNATIKVVGSDVYYIPSGNNPVGIFIIDLENKGQSISLTIVPKSDIPGQNIIVKLEDFRAAPSLIAGTGNPIPKNPADYNGYVQSVMSQAIRGKIEGFSIVPLEGGVAKMGDLVIKPDLVFTGPVVDVYRYEIKNDGTKLMDLNESAFYRKDIRAVAFFPHLALKRGESGYVFILADKPDAASSP